MTRSPFLLALYTTMMVLALVVSPASTPAVAQGFVPELIRQVNVPGFRDPKFPSVLGVGNTAYVSVASGSNNDLRVLMTSITQPFQTANFVANADLGNADGNPAFSGTASTTGPDGAMYQAWIKSETKEYKIRRRGANDTEFGPERTIVSGGGFRVRPDIAVTSTGKIMALWDEDSRYRYRISTDSGNTWGPTQLVSEDDTAGRAYIVADGTGGIWVAYSTAGNRGAGRVKAGFWRDDSFAMRDLTPDKTNGDYFADASITVSPDNIPHVAWRRVEGGIYYARRDPITGDWNRSRLVGGRATAYGTVAISSDTAGNLHLAWAGDTSGSFEVWFAYQPIGQAWQGPIRGSTDGNLDANFNVSTTVSDYSYGHIVGERFTDSGLVTRYTAVRALGSNCTGSLVLKDASTGSTDATDENPIPGTVTPNNCTPATMQVTLNTPPVATTDKIAYTASPSFAVPVNLAGSQCVQTAYVHLYKDATATFSAGSIFSKSIILDPPGDVDAVVQALNPNASLSPVYTPFAGDVGTSAGASGGDPAWTRTQQFLMQIQNDGDCTGLRAFTVAGGAQTNITNGYFSNVLALPTSTTPAPGVQAFDIAVSDTIGNLKVFPRSINYDPLSTAVTGPPNENGRPTVISATITNDNGSATARKSILRTLSFSGVNVTDNLYRPNNVGSQFWGVWVANGPRNVANPDPSTLLWIPVGVPQPGATFTVPWNIFNNGLGPRTDQDGSYVVFVRFLDGAGNPSTRVLSTTLTLDPGYSLPTQYLPAVLKP